MQLLMCEYILQNPLVDTNEDQYNILLKLKVK